MKLTATKNSSNAQFYRDKTKGQLISTKVNNTSKIIEKSDKTKDIIENLDHKRSLKGRILINPDSKGKIKEHIDYIIHMLIENMPINDLYRKKPTLSDYEKKDENLKKIINNTLSVYGKKLKYNSNSKNLEEILICYFKNEDITSEFENIRNYFQTVITHKKEKLVKSIKNNKIPFDLDNNSLQPNSEKMKWLFSFINNGVITAEIKENKFLKDIYKYENLERDLNNQIENDKPVMTKKLYQMVLDYNQDIYINHIKNKNEQDSFYLNEIREHFRRYLVISKKSNTKNQNGYNEKIKPEKIRHHIAYEFVTENIQKHIINQLVAGLIQYGKLHHYFYDKTTSSWQKEKLNSDGLSEIQVEEAFKKQILTSISSGIAKLNYFYNHGSQNESKIDTSANGDILLNRNIKLDCDIQGSIKSDVKYKIATCFPITLDDNDSKLEDLIQNLKKEIIYPIRNNVFHFKKNELKNLFNDGNNNDKNTSLDFIKELLKRDLDSIQERFKEQIRSSGITEYCSFELLKNIFQGNSFDFQLYSPQYPMSPSFKNIYKRGCNLSNATVKDEKIKWIKTLDTDAENDGQLAYKNLLQLIYYHCFLPYVFKNESYLIKYIKTTKEWNRQKAKKEHQYRYENMPFYDNKFTSLNDYFQNLQRLQSIYENDEDAKHENYYLDFIKDIFLLAFDDYLEDKLKNYKYKLIFSEKLVNSSLETLENLFNKNNTILKMNVNSSFENNLNFYTFLRVLEQRELNNLLHQIIRYRTSTKENTLMAVEELITLVQYTIPLQTADEHFKNELENHFKYFFEDKNFNNNCKLYYQSDKKTPIAHRSMSLMGRSGIMALFKVMFSTDYKIKKKDFNNYLKMIDSTKLINDETPKSIQDKQKKVHDLHRELVSKKIINIKNKDDMDKLEEYEKLVKKIKEYEHLRHKLTFETLYKVYKIYLDIISRLASFAEDWERDMYFMMIALKELNHINDDVDAIFSKGKVVSKLSLKLNLESKQLFAFLCSFDSNDIYNFMKIRNSVAHLNHMNQYNDKNTPQSDIIELINRIRILLAYDLKRQNSVTKSIIEILEKQHGIKIKFTGKKDNNNYNFELNSVESDNIIHLKKLQKDKDKDKDKDNKIKIPTHDEPTIKLVEKLLTFKFQ